MKLIEVRSYRLKPGCAERFVAAMRTALPLVRASRMDVVAFGRSDHEEESFFLIRAFDNREQLVVQQDAFMAPMSGAKARVKSWSAAWTPI